MKEDSILWIDAETTGVDIQIDKICEISLVPTNLLCSEIKEKEICSWTVNPEKESTKEALEKHGLTTEFLKKYPPFSTVASDILSVLTEYKYIGGYNILSFDVPLLLEEFSRCDIKWSYHAHTFIDPFKILSKYESKKLSDVYKRFTGNNIEGEHTTLGDIKATIEIFPKMITFFNIDNVVNELITYDSNNLDIQGNLYFNESGTVCLGFGKYKGRSIIEVIEIDKNYIMWILEKADKISNTTKKILKEFLLFYLEEKKKNVKNR